MHSVAKVVDARVCHLDNVALRMIAAPFDGLVACVGAWNNFKLFSTSIANNANNSDLLAQLSVLLLNCNFIGIAIGALLARDRAKCRERWVLTLCSIALLRQPFATACAAFLGIEVLAAG